MFKIFCKLGFHVWHTSANGMKRLCPNCNMFEQNVNSPNDPIICWRKVTVENIHEIDDSQVAVVTPDGSIDLRANPAK